MREDVDIVRKSVRRKFEVRLASGSAKIAMLDLGFPGLSLPLGTSMPARGVFILEYVPGTPDLEVDEAGVTATLLFGGKPFRAHVPWLAIAGMSEVSAPDRLVVDTRRDNDLPGALKIDRSLVERLLSEFCTMRVYLGCHPLVSGIPESSLPEGWSIGQRDLCLEYGLDMPKPISDLVCEDGGIRATLSFDCEPHLTFVPYDAIAAIRCRGLRSSSRSLPRRGLTSV